MHRSLIRRRVPVVLAVSGALLVAACGSSGSGPSAGNTANPQPTASGDTSTTAGAYGTLPPASGTPTKGGTVTYAITAGSTPTYISPIVPLQDGSLYDQQFYNLLFRPLYWTVVGNRPVVNTDLSIGELPTFSDGGKTVTINLKKTYKWHSGKPVVAKDVVFFIDVLKAALKENPSNFSNYSKGDFPDNVVSTATPNPYTLVLHLTQAYNPTWFLETQLNQITPLPSEDWNIAAAGGPHLDYTNPANAKKIYDYIDSQAKKLSTYATNPLWQDSDGPFLLTSFNTTTDANTMVPNPTYGGPQKAQFATLKAEYFASVTAEFNALRAGTLDQGGVDFASLPQVPTLKNEGYNVYGYPALGFFYMVLNFKDTTGNWDKLISQPYIRQTLAHLQDEDAVIKGGFHGAAGPAYGPVPAIPQTPFVPKDSATNPYPFSTTDAANLLTAHGWKVVPDGTTTCIKPGTAAGECGAGIPAGQAINIRIPYSNDPPVTGQETIQFASDAKKVGINITPISKTFNYLIGNYDDKGHPENENKWEMQNFGGFGGITYPTTDEIFNSDGEFNEGDYDSAEADKLITASKLSSDPAAVQAEASFLTKDLPALFGPNPDMIIAWKNVSGPPDSFANITQGVFTPEYWYVTGGS